MSAKKITVVGAGHVGATCSQLLAQKELAREVILVDIDSPAHKAGIKVGEIIRAARADDQRVEFLAVVKTDSVYEHLVCSEEQDTQITKETLPTEVSLATTKPQA